METATRDVWEFLELPNPHAQAAADLYRWGLNFDNGKNPFVLFLDLIGWTEETWGQRSGTSPDCLGFMECDYLGDALKEYANRPHEVTRWIDELMECENV